MSTITYTISICRSYNINEVLFSFLIMIDTEKLKIDIGKRIKEARLATDYTQEQIADRLNITSQSVSNLENGKYLPKLLHLEAR